MIPALLARIRIPVPDELAGPLMVLGAIMLLIIVIVLMNGQWARGGLAALAAFVFLLASFLFSVTAIGNAWMFGSSATQDVVLVGAGLLAWQVRGRRFDLPAAAIGAAVYGLCAPLISSLFAGGRVFRISSVVGAAVWALCFLGALVTLAPRIQPRGAGMLVGAAVGALLGAVLAPLMAGGSPAPRMLLASAVHGLVLGAALVLALRAFSRTARA